MAENVFWPSLHGERLLRGLLICMNLYRNDEDLRTSGALEIISFSVEKTLKIALLFMDMIIDGRR